MGLLSHWKVRRYNGNRADAPVLIAKGTQNESNHRGTMDSVGTVHIGKDRNS